MALSLVTVLTLTLTICMTPEEGAGLPVPREHAVHSHPAPHRVRAKRCSCSNWLDVECIYFCHLDIIWVNTPSKTIPYGLGSPLSRRRRSAGRCECVDSADKACAAFCYQSTEDPIPLLVRPSHRETNVPLAPRTYPPQAGRVGQSPWEDTSKASPSSHQIERGG